MLLKDKYIYLDLKNKIFISPLFVIIDWSIWNPFNELSYIKEIRIKWKRLYTIWKYWILFDLEKKKVVKNNIVYLGENKQEIYFLNINVIYRLNTITNKTDIVAKNINYYNVDEEYIYWYAYNEYKKINFKKINSKPETDSLNKAIAVKDYFLIKNLKGWNEKFLNILVNNKFLFKKRLVYDNINEVYFFEKNKDLLQNDLFIYDNTIYHLKNNKKEQGDYIEVTNDFIFIKKEKILYIYDLNLKLIDSISFENLSWFYVIDTIEQDDNFILITDHKWNILIYNISNKKFKTIKMWNNNSFSPLNVYSIYKINEETIYLKIINTLQNKNMIYNFKNDKIKDIEYNLYYIVRLIDDFFLGIEKENNRIKILIFDLLFSTKFEISLDENIFDNINLFLDKYKMWKIKELKEIKSKNIDFDLLF